MKKLLFGIAVLVLASCLAKADSSNTEQPVASFQAVRYATHDILTYPQISANNKLSYFSADRQQLPEGACVALGYKSNGAAIIASVNLFSIGKASQMVLTNTNGDVTGTYKINFVKNYSVIKTLRCER